MTIQPAPVETRRSIPEWVGDTPDTPAPPRVRMRVFEREHSRCHHCGRLIRAGEKWTLEHRIAIINGGANAEANMCLTCCNCLPDKNATDAAEKSKIYQKRKKHLGIKSRKSRPMAGTVASGWRKPMNKPAVRR